MAIESNTNENVHYMQTEVWGNVKDTAGWKSENLAFKGQTIQIYCRNIPLLGTFLYIPGLMGIEKANVGNLTKLLKNKYHKKSFALRLELNQAEDSKLVQEFQLAGWSICNKHVQYRHTILIDLTKPEDDTWMGFKSRGRYEALQAHKAGVTIQEVESTTDNFNEMYKLMQVTSNRNKFFIRSKEFSMSYWKKFASQGQLKLFFAMHGGSIISGTVVITTGKLAWNKDGGSIRGNTNLMAPRLMQWEIMKKLKKSGITSYDLGGISDPESFSKSSMPGIYVFKSGFSKESVAFMPTLELPLSARYKLWPFVEKQWLRIYNLFAHDLWY